MSKYNIVVHSIVKTSSSSFTGTFSLTDNEITVNGRTVSATVTGAVDSIQYNGVAIAKIRGTQGTRLGVPTPGKIGDQDVSVVWLQGHRGSVAAAFAALWTKIQATGETEIKDVANPSGRGRSAVTFTAAPAVDDTKVKELEAKLEAAAANQAEANARAERLELMLLQLMERMTPPAAAPTADAKATTGTKAK
jgi:hypothetical protein